VVVAPGSRWHHHPIRHGAPSVGTSTSRGRRPQNPAVIALTDGIAFCPYVWRAGWDALQETWESLTRRWPTITATLSIARPGDLYDNYSLRFSDEPLPTDQRPVMVTVQAARGHWTLMQESFERDDVAAFFFEIDTAGPEAGSQQLDDELERQISIDLEELDGHLDEEPAAALEAQLNWHATVEKRRRETAEDPVDTWQDAISDVHDFFDDDLHPERFEPPFKEEDPPLQHRDDEAAIQQANKAAGFAITESPASTSSDTANGNTDELPDDLPF
jgi:hypothetical protein